MPNQYLDSMFMQYFIDPSTSKYKGHIEEKPEKVLNPLPEYNPKESYLGSDPLDLLTDRAEALKQKADALVYLIEKRREINNGINKDIDNNICELDSKVIFLRETWPLGTNVSVDKSRFSLYQDLTSLEKQKRDERVACWRDASELEQSLIDAANEFNQASKRADIANRWNEWN